MAGRHLLIMSKLVKLEIQDGGSRHLEFFLYDNNSKSFIRIVTKFDREEHMDNFYEMEVKYLPFMKFQDGGGRHIDGNRK
jgi:hypothetical protein